MIMINETFFSIEGEGPFIGVPTFFIRLTGCNLRCNWTPIGDTKILMSDYRWKKAKDVKVGDSVCGFKGRYLQASKVKNTIKTRSPAITLSMESGKTITVTPEHPFYYRGNRTTRADRMLGRSIRTIGRIDSDIIDTEKYKFGWIGGVIDGEGNVNFRSRNTQPEVRVYLNDKDGMDTLISFIRDVGYSAHYQKFNHNGFSSNEITKAVYLGGQDNSGKLFEKINSLKQDPEFLRGYISGIIDSEGSVQGAVRIAQKKVVVRNEIENALQKLRVDYVLESRSKPVDAWVYRLTGNLYSNYFFFKWKLRRKVDAVFQRAMHCSAERVVKIEMAGTFEINHFETETHNYISDGYLSHNCDTKYSFVGGERRDVESLIEEASKYKTKFVCITGGEPLLQKEVYQLMDRLLNKDFRIILETSGSLSVEDVPNEDNMIISMDIKTPSSKMVEHNLYDNIGLLASKDYLKFVIADEVDYEFAKIIINKYPFEGEIIFQPEGGKDLKFLAEKVLNERLNVRVLPQLHKFIWGNERGR